MLKDANFTPMDVLKKIGSIFSKSVNKGLLDESLVEFSRNTRLEPIVMLDNTLEHYDFMTDVAQSITSQFTAYYLQSFASMMTVGDISVGKLLDKLSDRRDPLRSAARSFESVHFSLEDYDYALPDYSKPSVSTEGGGSRRGPDVFKDAVDLSVGKMFEVEMQRGNDRVVIPMSVRLNMKKLAPTSMLNILSSGKKGRTMAEAWHGLRSGELEFLRDILFAEDLIEAHKEAAMKDDSDIYMTLHERRKKNRQAGAVSMDPSVNNASSVVVISADNAKQLERTVGMSLDKFRQREKLMQATNTMILTVVDPEWEHVTFYTRSIESEVELSLRELKNSNKRNGPDVSDILKAYQLGNAPSL